MSEAEEKIANAVKAGQIGVYPTIDLTAWTKFQLELAQVLWREAARWNPFLAPFVRR